MNDAPLSWRTFGPAAARGWSRFIFAPFEPRVARLVRVFYAILVLTNLAAWLPSLELWFGESGVAPREVVRRLQSPYAFSLLDLLPPTAVALRAAYGCFVAQAVLLLAGVWPRLQATGTFVWLVSFQNRNTLIWDGEDDALRLIGFFVMLLAWTGGGPGPTDPRTDRRTWPLRLLQLQICAIFLDTAFAKSRGDTWLDGTALYYASRLDLFMRHESIVAPLFDWPACVALATWGVLLVEFLAPALVWFRETRRAALAAALAFHAASIVSMHLFLFHWVMLCGWCAFLTNDDLDAAARWRRRLLGR